MHRHRNHFWNRTILLGMKDGQSFWAEFLWSAIHKSCVTVKVRFFPQIKRIICPSLTDSTFCLLWSFKIWEELIHTESIPTGWHPWSVIHPVETAKESELQFSLIVHHRELKDNQIPYLPLPMRSLQRFTLT